MTLTRFDKDTQVKDLAGGLNYNSDIIEDHFDAINPHPQGRLVLDVSGDQDINLTAEQARSGQLIFTGVLTGNINVIVPCSCMVYHVQNQTSGDYTLTIKTGAGNGVLIQQASLPDHPRIKRVLCDGTDVVWADGSQIVEDNLHEETPDTGYYIRYANGVQVCYGNVYGQEELDVTFPQPFTSRPAVLVTAERPVNFGVFILPWEFSVMPPDESVSRVSFMAIGRWK